MLRDLSSRHPESHLIASMSEDSQVLSRKKCQVPVRFVELHELQELRTGSQHGAGKLGKPSWAGVP